MPVCVGIMLLWRETSSRQGEFADALQPARLGGPRYVDARARHLILRIGSPTARPEAVAEQLLPALKEIA